jgi:hypothetical protein
MKARGCGSFPALVIALAVAGCHVGQPKQAEDPDPLGLGADIQEVEEDESDGPTSDSSDGDDGADEESDGSLDSSAAGPQFTANMSVAEAQAAVPPDADRLNMEQEVLAKPLQDGDLYEPCKLGGGHFEATVAVWDGRVVGLDLTTTPNNPTLTECLAKQIRTVKWRDKVKSLNTVTFSF